jgi:phosphomannomutase
MDIRFGTGGWREIIGESFTRENVERIADAMAQRILREGDPDTGIIIGYDRRFLSEEAAAWAASTFAASGVYTELISKATPTPLIMFHVERNPNFYGMAVTASHNPAIYNGIKLFQRGGGDANLDFTEDIESIIRERKELSLPHMDFEEAKARGLIRMIDPTNAYLDNIMATLDTEAIRKRGLKVAFDPMFGVGRTPMLTLLYSLRCEADIIHAQRDPLFGGRLPAPTEYTLANLMLHVREGNFDIGLATDGDADRLGVIDELGQFVHFNKVMVLLYWYLLEYKGWRGPCVRNLSTTHLLDKVATAYGQTCYEVPVGFKYISEKMNETGAILGGESSGGMTVVGHIRGKDGVYSGALLVEMLSVTGQSMSELWQKIQDLYGKCEMLEREYRFSPEEKIRVQRQLLVDRKVPTFTKEVQKISYMDGCKVYFTDDSWVSVRFSGTEDLMRIFCETPDEEEAISVIRTWERFLDINA